MPQLAPRTAPKRAKFAASRRRATVVGSTETINGVVGRKARILVRVKSSRRHMHEFLHQCEHLGCEVRKLDADLWGKNTLGQVALVWFDVVGTDWAICQVNDLPSVVESEYAISTRVPHQGQGAGPEKVRPTPPTGFTTEANLESKALIARAEMAANERNRTADRPWGNTALVKSRLGTELTSLAHDMAGL